MTIPTITYPTAIDSNQNLYQVRDGLRVQLAEDYNPGDTSITIVGDLTNFDSTGIITLTEQCSEAELRAISFYYGSRTSTTFDQLELLSGFIDSAKPKNLTNVTQNVMALHHNNLKDAIIQIENFAGKSTDSPIGPLEGTMHQRINYLRSIALAPKAWFSADQTIGLAPLKVTFEDQSFQLGTDGTSQTVTRIWDFGDNTGPSIITIDETTEVPSNITNVLVNEVGTGNTITKTYTKPGIYSVSLTVTNDFGTDEVIFDDYIQARFPAPDYAAIEFVLGPNQVITAGSPSGGPYPPPFATPPKIRSVANQIINIQLGPAGYVNSGINPNTGRTYAGEEVDMTNTPIDPIESYTWIINDDTAHNNSYSARAVFSVGGIYDLTLRADTKFGSYRITNYLSAFDIVEQVNLWLWTYNSNGTVSSNEFGLISETFKSTSSYTLSLSKDDSFLTGAVNESQQKREFNRNNGFVQRGSSSSGSGGKGILYWASGRGPLDSASVEKVKMSEFDGFLGTYLSKPDHYRPWNWVSFASSSTLYFILGGVTGTIAPNTSPTNQTKDAITLSSLVYDSPAQTLENSNYKNGAEELKNNQVSYDMSGNSLQGNMSVYKSCWYNDAGYFLRNEGVGNFFRIKSFYKTSGNSTEAFINISKLLDMPGSAKVEGQLVPLSQGVYFFNNSGAVSAYNPTSNIWSTGGPGLNSATFQSLQDVSVSGFSDASQTLLATSDGSANAYLSFDYSPNTFIKFNETDTTFHGISSRPSASQWQMGIF